MQDLVQNLTVEVPSVRATVEYLIQEYQWPKNSLVNFNKVNYVKMRTFVKRKLKGTAASEHYVPVGSVETVEDNHTGNAVLVHTTCYKRLQKV